MKKLSLVVLMIAALSACTETIYSHQGNASIIDSKSISAERVELVIQKDSGELVTLQRERDERASVGARVSLTESNGKQPNLVIIQHHEFK